MASTLGVKFPKTVDVSVKGPAPAGPAETPKSVSPADALEQGGAKHAIRSGKAGAVFGAEIQGSSVRSTFPLEDLGQITTSGRFAQGFRLDGGSLRRMWMSARRTLSADGTPGFELFFQAQGPTVSNYKRRLEQAGATPSTYRFSAATPEERGPGQSVLKATGDAWGPSSQTAVCLEQAGKWKVDMVTDRSEALKGAFRIRVSGDDAEATAALQEVIQKLGLQTIFAPPSPIALERFKLLHFIWQVAPGAADHLRNKPIRQLADQLGELLEQAEVSADARQQVATAKLDTKEMKERSQLSALLYETSPKAYLEWAAQVQPVVLRPGLRDLSASLKNALKGVGIAESSAAYKGALSSKVDPAESRALLELALLAKKDMGAAQGHTQRDLDQVKLADVQAVLSKLGIEPESERVKSLRFEEVYPGYFTVIDPVLAKAAEEAGARYLYSTSDNPERVWTTLTGGQKASLTRFQEGLLVQGKSSDSDFTSGGAGSVFSRLVTRSAIKEGKTTTNYGGGFNDWGGSRPFKLILNRRLLGRADWYAYNGDNFGRTTTLKPENHGEAIIKTINGSYSSSNEVMFPIGNDPAFVDFVVAPSEEKKKELVDYLTAQGMTEFNGKPLDQLVLVRTRFFEHPDDETLSQAVADAINPAAFGEALETLRGAAKTQAETALKSELPGLVGQVLETEAKAQLLEAAAPNALEHLQKAAAKALQEDAGPLQALGIEAKAAETVPAAVQAASEVAAQSAADLSLYTTYSIDSAVREASHKSGTAAAEKWVGEALKTLVEESPKTEDTKEARQQLKKRLQDSLTETLTPKVRAYVEAHGGAAAKKEVASQLAGSVKSSATQRAMQAARASAAEAAALAVEPQAIAQLVAAAEQAALEAAKEPILTSLKDRGGGWIRGKLEPQLKERAERLATEAAAMTAVPSLLQAIQGPALAAGEKAAETFTASHPGKSTPEEQASIAETVQLAITDLARGVCQSAAKSATSSALSEVLNQRLMALKESDSLYPSLAVELAAAHAAAGASTAVDEHIERVVEKVIQGPVAEAVQAALDEGKAEVSEALVSAAIDRITRWVIDAALSKQATKIDKATSLIIKGEHHFGWWSQLWA